MRRFPSLLLLGLLAPALQAREFTLNGQVFTLPEGFTIECVAAPPLVQRPVSGSLDDQGRLYVTDSSGSNAPMEQQLANPDHRILCLEDTHHNGIFDRVTVFADKVMFPEGLLWHEGAIYLGGPPSIWKFTDPGHTGTATERLEWYQGKTLGHCANDIHGPYLGPEGLLYWCKGAFAEQTHERLGKPTIHDRASHIFRSRLDGSDFDSVMTGGMDNPVEIAFTPEGEPIFTSTFLDLSGEGKRDGLGHAVYGGLFPKVNEVTDEVAHTGPLLPAMTHFGPGAPCGLRRFDSDGFGPEYRDNLFACLFNLHKVTRHILVPQGATFRTEDSDFLTSNSQDFHPTGVIVSPDGSLLVIDTGGWYKICCPTSQLAKPDVLGAIYRIRRENAPKLPVTPDAIRSAEENLWRLSRESGENARGAVRKELQNPEPRVRQTAAKIVSLWRDGAAIDALLPMLETASQTPHLSRVAAEALGRIGDARAIPSLLRNAPGPSDRFLEHAYIYALEEIADPKETALGLAAASINTRRAALIALNEMPGHPLTAETAVPLLSSSDPLLRETALWLASRHTDWGGPLAGFAKEQLATADKRAPSGREDLAAFLHQCAKAPEIQALLADTIRQGSPTARTVALNAMGHTDAKEIPEAWSTALSAALAQSDPAVLAAAVTTARVFNTRKTALTALRPALLALAANADRPAALRLAALAALPTGYVPGTPENFTLLLGALKNTATSSLDRGTAASILGHTKLTAEQRGALADAAATFGPQEASKILPAFESGVDPALGHRLLASLAQSPGLAGLQPQALRAVVAKLPPSLEAESTALLAKLQVDASAQKAHLDSLAAELPTGDIRRGQAIFNSQRVGCTLCHSIGYLGGKLGPDLSSVGKVRNERDLLEAIVYPSASFVRSYEPTIVRTAKGEEMMGIVKGESNDGLTLAMAPGVETHIPRAEIAELRPGTVSLMPQGFEQILTKQELADVIAFLKASQR